MFNFTLMTPLLSQLLQQDKKAKKQNYIGKCKQKQMNVIKGAALLQCIVKQELVSYIAKVSF